MRERIYLDGEWLFFADKENIGKQERLFDKNTYLKWEGTKTISVPSCWELFEEDYEGVAWYGKTFDVSQSHEGQVLKINFDAVNYLTEVYINGMPVGYHKGGYTGFELDIQDFICYGQENFISVRVVSPLITSDKVIDGVAKNEVPHWRAALVAGIYQSVYIEVVNPVYTSDLHVIPNIIDGSATANVSIYSELKGVTSSSVNISIFDESSTVSFNKKLTLEPGSNEFSFELTLDSFKFWTLDDPHLYTCKVAIISQSEEDVSQCRFGMRSFDFEDNAFLLNNKKLYIKAVFHECLFPFTLATPHHIDIVKKELKLAKEAGINLIRPWRRPLPSYIYDLADEIGMMYVGSIPIECMNYYPELTPYLEEQVTTEFSEMIRRNRNHPSIVIWELFNEVQRLPLKRLKHKVSIIGRDLDGSRVIFDESGGFAGGANIYKPWSKVPTPINDIHSYPSAPLSEKRYQELLNIGSAHEVVKSQDRDTFVLEGVMTNVSELGYGSLPRLESNMIEYYQHGNKLTPDYKIHERLLLSLKAAMEDNKLYEIYPTVDDFCDATQIVHAEGNKYMIEACRVNRNVSGLVIHAYTDGDWIFGAGILDIFRNPKAAYYTLKDLFSDDYIKIRSNKPNFFVGEKIAIDLTVVNDKDNYLTNIDVTILNDKGKPVYTTTLNNVNNDSGINELELLTFEPQTSGTYVIEASMQTPSNGVITNDYTVKVYEELNWSSVRNNITYLDGTDNISSFFDGIEDVTVTVFEPSQPVTDILLLGSYDESNPKFKTVFDWVERGGTAIILDLPEGDKVHGKTGWNYLLHDSDYVPFNLTMVPGDGLWVGRNHIVRQSPLFEGISSNCMIDNSWMNIVPTRSILDHPIGWEMGLVTYDWFDGLDHLQDYRGVDKVYSAANVYFKPFGKGLYLVNTIPISRNLAHEVLAQKILFNMCLYCN